MKSKKPVDDSENQKKLIEKYLLDEFNKKNGLNLIPGRLELEEGKAPVDVDGYDENSEVVCEIFARTGAFKSGQNRKIASDILKLVLVKEVLGRDIRAVIIIPEGSEAVRLNDPESTGWQALAVEKFGIEIEEIPLSTKISKLLGGAQKRKK